MQPTAWTKVTTTSLDYPSLVPGATYCFSARARDTYGNVSTWSAPRCTSRALDDRSLRVGTGWAAKTSAGYYFNTLLAGSKTGVVLTRPSAQVARIALVATRCPTCGIVGVYVDSTLVGTVNLAASTTLRQQVIPLRPFALRTGTVVVKVLSSGKLVQVDGLGISRS
jgi:hypothetical protein